MKNGPEAFAAALSTMPFFLLIFVVLGHATPHAWRIVALVALVPSGLLWLYFGSRYWRAWKAYQAEMGELRQKREDDAADRSSDR